MAAAIIVAGVWGVGPSFAADDGQEPLWSALSELVGLTSKPKDPPIHYRERARLVLPPKMTLPPPLPPAAQRTADWPTDPEVVKERKEKEDTLRILQKQGDVQELKDGHRVSAEALREDRSPPGHADNSRHCASDSSLRNCKPTPFHNVFEFFGLAKADDVVAGVEPDRDWLTDPPKGYRAPTANTTASNLDEYKAPSDRDPRAALFHAPDQ